MRCYSQQIDPVAQGYPPCLRTISATAILVKATEEIIMGYLLTIFVPHAVEAFINSHHTQHFSVSSLTSYEIVFLTAPHVTLILLFSSPPSLMKPLMTA